MTYPNPIPHHDYLIIRTHQAGPLAMRVRYVPDRLIVSDDEFTALCHALPVDALPEQAAGTLLDRLNDLLVPRWLEVRCTSADAAHLVIIEDSQPGWSNPHFLDRLERLG